MPFSEAYQAIINSPAVAAAILRLFAEWATLVLSWDLFCSIWSSWLLQVVVVTMCCDSGQSEMEALVVSLYFNSFTNSACVCGLFVSNCM